MHTALIHALAYALPSTLFIHAFWRMSRAGRERSMLLATPPAFTATIATVWLANVGAAHLNGKFDEAQAHLTVAAGPWLLFFLMVMVEVPFWSLRANERRSRNRMLKGLQTSEGAKP